MKIQNRICLAGFWFGIVLPAAVDHASLHAETNSASPVLSWVFAIRDDRQEVPHGRVFLQIGRRRVLVQSEANVHFQPVARTEYKIYDMPQSAILACQGWFAGGGEDLYVVRRGNRLNIYRRDVEEQSPWEPYRLIKSLPVPKRS